MGNNLRRTETRSGARDTDEHGPEALGGTPSVALGAGRSQVQILSPRLTKSLQMALLTIWACRLGVPLFW